MAEDVKKDNNKMAELAAENEDGIPTDAQIAEAVNEQMVILDGLMSSKDTVSEIMGYVRELQNVNAKVAAGDDDKKDAVVIGTMHSWKGLEVPKMFLPMVRGKFPRAKIGKNPETGKLECEPPDPNDPALASERRLAYVAITRAEDDCVILDIPHPKLPCAPSQFLDEACIPMGGAPRVEPEPPEDTDGLPARVAKLSEAWDFGDWSDVDEPPDMGWDFEDWEGMGESETTPDSSDLETLWFGLED
jgi:hypothetical protein